MEFFRRKTYSSFCKQCDEYLMAVSRRETKIFFFVNLFKKKKIKPNNKKNVNLFFKKKKKINIFLIDISCKFLD